MNVKEVYVLFIFRNVYGAFTSSGGRTTLRKVKQSGVHSHINYLLNL